MSESPRISIPWLLGIYLVLMVLLASTVAVGQFDLGALSLLIALAIAGTKAALVVLYFMHVRFSSRVTWLFVATGLLWLGVLFTLTFAEYIGRSRLSRTSPLSTATFQKTQSE